MVVLDLRLKGDSIISLIGIQIEGPAGIDEKAMIAEADWAGGGIWMTELLKGEMYLEIKIEMNVFKVRP
jgi:hypothetical protein